MTEPLLRDDRRVAATSSGRITVDPSVMGGQPCVRGMRMPVSTVIAMLEDDMTAAEILAEHPELEPEDLAACVEHAAREAEDDSPGFDVRAWLVYTDGLPTLDIGIEAATLFRQDRVERGG